jgi:predicted ABC-type ATPase
VPELYIITGSNGAGKSSVGPEYLPPHIKATCVLFDGDKLTLQKVRELKEHHKYGHKDAKEIAEDWIGQHFNTTAEDHLKNNSHFAYEGHFREESSWKVIERFKKAGYKIHMIFLGLINIERSQMRVLERAIGGGHNVSFAEIDLNYQGNLIQLDHHYKLLDSLRIIDTSETVPKLLAEISKSKVSHCLPITEQPDWFTNYLINITRQLYPGI